MKDQRREVMIELIEALGAREILPRDACERWVARLRNEEGLVARGLSMLNKKFDALQLDAPVPLGGQVWRDPDGSKHVLKTLVAKTWDGEAPEGWTYVCGKAHGEEDGDGNLAPDFSYTCYGNQWCRCLQ